MSIPLDGLGRSPATHGGARGLFTKAKEALGTYLLVKSLGEDEDLCVCVFWGFGVRVGASLGLILSLEISFTPPPLGHFSSPGKIVTQIFW